MNDFQEIGITENDLAWMVSAVLSCSTDHVYARRIASEIAPAVAKDIAECADTTAWNDSDIRLAIGRVLAARLGIAS